MILFLIVHIITIILNIIGSIRSFCKGDNFTYMCFNTNIMFLSVILGMLLGGIK